MLGMQEKSICRPVATAVQPRTRFLLGVIQARAGAQPHSSLAAALAATITPACRASGSAAQAMFQVPAPTTPGVWTAVKYLSTSPARSPGWPCIDVFAAWQAWKYSSSVEYEGTLILVVTPAGEIATTPGAAAAAVVTVLDGEVDAVGAFVPVAEQPIVADAAARTATVPHVRGRDGRDRTWSIYATLATVTQRTRYWECCRP
jgi:hypothetical protein